MTLELKLALQPPPLHRFEEHNWSSDLFVTNSYSYFTLLIKSFFMTGKNILASITSSQVGLYMVDSQSSQLLGFANPNYWKSLLWAK